MSRIREQAILRARSDSGSGPRSGPVWLEKTRSKIDVEEVFTISHERPNQYVTMGAALTTNCKQLQTDILRENMEVFAWARSERERLIRKVRHPEWITSAIPIKLANGTWKVQMDYSSHNKACPKDMYPFSEEREELASIMGYPYKCFLRLSKEYSQIRMAEDDEEKNGFHTEEGLAELKQPIHEARTRIETAKESGWTNEAEEALQRIKRKLDNLQTLTIPKEGETLIKEAKGLVMKKFFGQGEQVERTPYANEGGTFTLGKELQAKSTPIPRA
ncbi:hypothetical protein Tco_1051270 [Tanacetum coccineum]